ncbi:hypothetical protein GCM10027162_60550 [Streptomyces incanus]
MRRWAARKPSKYDSGRRGASATAYWSGPAETYVRYCFAERTAVTGSGVPVTQPTPRSYAYVCAARGRW